MNGTRTLVISIALLAMLVTSGWAATLEVSQPVQVTSDSYYERGQAIVYDGTNYWLFYGRSASCNTPYSGVINPDIHDYAIYYKKATTIPDLVLATPVAVPGATDCYLGETGAAVVDGNVWTFGAVPSLNFPGAKSLYGWYTSDNGGSWNQVADLWDDMPNGAAHHDETGFDGKLYLMAGYPESYSGWYSKWTDDPTAGSITWSSPIPLNSTSNLINGTGHFFVEGATLYIGILRTSPTKDNKVLEYSTGPETWTELCTASSTGWDGTLFKAGTEYVYAQAPWMDPDRQYIIAWSGGTPSTVLSGSSHMVAEGRSGSNNWVDMWPIGFTDALGTSYLFYTSERDAPAAEGVGNIWYLEVDWTVSNDHYTYIQEAVDVASSGDAVSVGPGMYVEQVTIDKSLLLTGDGEITTTIQAPAADRAGSVVNGTSTWDYILAAYPASGTIDVRVERFTFDGNGENKSTGTDGLVGVFMRDVDGTTAGLHSCTIQNFAATEYESWGVRVYGDSDLTLHDNTLSGYTRDGITVNGDDGAGADPVAVVSDNDLTGSALCLNGIQVGYGATGTLTGNTVRNHTRSSPWAAVGLFAYESDGVTIGAAGDGNTVQNCFDGILLKRSDGSSIVGNTLTENIAYHIGIDESDNNQVSANVLTSSTAIPDKAIGISNGATGNMIGGATASDGNTITIPTSGGLLYGIYVQSTTGSGSNTVQNNTFAGGTRFVQVDGGNSGTTTVADNTVSNCSFAGVYFNAGSGIITGNTLTNTVRPVEFWGANNVTIENNYVDGAAFDGINAGAFTGTVTVTENAFLSTSGRSLNNRTTTPIDASQNYWGVTTASGVADEIDGDAYVDYTPWLGGGTHDSPGFTGDYSTLYVDDDGAQTGSSARIQEGIDLATGSTVNVLDGTYRADAATGRGAYITKDGLSLIGESQAGTIIDGSVGGVGGSGAYWPKGIHVEADGVTVRNFTVKDFTGDLVSTGGYGVLHRDYAHDEIGEGYVFYDGCTVEDVTVTDCYSSIYALCFTHLTVTGCTVTNSLADGMFIARGSDYANIHSNVVTNSGDHGIWVGYSWTATTPSDNAIISYNVVDGAREGGISFVASDSAVIEGNEITNVAAEGWSVGALSLKDGPSNVTARNNIIYGNDGGWGGYAGTGHGIGIDGTPSNITLNWNSIYGNAGDGCHNYSTVSVDATYNWWGDASGPGGVGPGSGDEVSTYVLYDPWIGKTGGENIVCDADPEYLSVATPTKTVDVNYLGGGGGLMYGYSLVFTWDGAIASTAPGSVTQGTLLSDAGSTFFFPRTTGVNEITVDCMLLGTEPGVTGPGKMFSIAFTGLAVGTSAIDITVDRVRDKDNVTLSGFFEDDGELIVDVSNPTVADVLITNDTLAHTNDYIKNTDQATVTANVSDDDPGFGLANIAADLTGLGGGAAVNPDAYADPVATWTLASVTCVPSDGVVTVTVTATDAMANTANANDTIIADNTAPTAVTGFDASPANEECDLSWTNGTDTYFAGVVVRRDAVGGEYPQYPWFVANWPSVDTAYPGSELLGTNVYDGAGTSVTDAVVARNIYYYQAFCYDEARNYGPAVSTARDLSTNYWLGDVSHVWGSWGYDGLVDANDILKLSDSYGTTNPVSYPGDAECDVGPTVHPDWNRLGLPKPDDVVEFEDAMIFAMNYGVVTARVVPFLPEEYSPVQLALTLSEREMVGNEIEVALRLEGNSGEVKGVSAEVAYDSNELEFVSARLSDDMSSPLADVFFWNGTQESRVLVDALVLGTDVTIGGSGDVAMLTFRMIGEGYSLDMESARIRNADNVELDAKLGGFESGGNTPLVFRLVQNAPNPFNPVTKIAYHVPSESEVTIRVYDVSGRAVRTLVDGVVEPGRHAAVWNGTNDKGESVGSGIYFCTMEAPDFHDRRKMTLLK